MANGQPFPKEMYIYIDAGSFSASENLDFIGMGDKFLVGTYKLLRVEQVESKLTITKTEVPLQE